MSFADTAVIFILALLLFGPKKLPVLARELGKWVGEFRRASNEFKMQMEEELRLSEQAERNKQIAAMEAAAPAAPALEASTSAPEASEDCHPEAQPKDLPLVEAATGTTPEPAPVTYELIDGVRTPVLPIASAGELNLMPPATGLPTPRNSALGGLLNAIPEAQPQPEPAPETASHGN
jgi:sec-independent protein translocase protein TatB